MNLKIKIIIIFTSIAVILSSILIYNSYRSSKKNFLTSLKKDSKKIVSYGAKNIDVGLCKEIIRKIGVEPGNYSNVNYSKKYLISKKKIYYIELDNTYQKLVNQLNRITNLKKESIIYAYILIPTAKNNFARIIVDANLSKRTVKKNLKNISETKLIAHSSQLYDISNQPATIHALAKKNCRVSDSFIRDEEYKSDSLMAFAPIRDKKGDYIATLGIDFSYSKIEKILYKEFLGNLVISLFLIGGFIILIIFSSSIISRPIERITEATKKVKKKNYNLNLEVNRKDEIGKLARNFNNMAEKIKEYENRLLDLNNKLEIENEELIITLQSIDNGIIMVDKNRKIRMMNDKAEKLTGWNFEDAFDLKSERVLLLLDHKSWDEIENPIEKIFKNKIYKQIVKKAMLIAKDGKKYTIKAKAVPLVDSEENLMGVVLILKDTTNKEKYRKKLNKNEKLEAVSLLVGSIANDFNNYLMGILGNINLMKLLLKRNIDRNRFLSLLNNAEEAANNAKELTKQFAHFTGSKEPIKNEVRIDKTLNNSFEEIQKNQDVNIKLSIEKNLKPIYGDLDQLKNVFKEIFNNALESIEEKNNIIISAKNTVLEENDLVPKLSGGFVKINIKDDGKGIKENVLNKVFNPFFTTKKGHKGLGLSIADSIIKRHNGQIIINSEYNKYTIISIYLPVAKEKKKIKDNINFERKG